MTSKVVGMVSLVDFNNVWVRLSILIMVLLVGSSCY